VDRSERATTTTEKGEKRDRNLSERETTCSLGRVLKEGKPLPKGRAHLLDDGNGSASDLEMVVTKKELQLHGEECRRKERRKTQGVVRIRLYGGGRGLGPKH